MFHDIVNLFYIIDEILNAIEKIAIAEKTRLLKEVAEAT
jgi:hypothetical protein